MSAASHDVFPETLRTWIGAELGRAQVGRKNVNHYLMGTYADPLRVYFLGTNSRWLGEPEDVINGFFASRLAQDDFFGKWQASGMRLRRWLMNAFSFYLMELRRQRRNDHQQAQEIADEPVTFSGDPERAIDHAAVLAFVRQAMEQAEQTCIKENLGQHWHVFVRHHLENADFKLLAEEFGVDAARAAVMSRTAARKFRAALHEVLIRDGVSPKQIDQEIQSLLEGGR